MGGLAADEGKSALDDLDDAAALARLRIVDELVQHHARIAAEREGHAVDEAEPERAGIIGDDHIVLKDRGADGGDDLAAVGAGDDHLALDRFDMADRRLVGCRTRSLGCRARPLNVGTGELGDDVGGENGAAAGMQIGCAVHGKIVENDQSRPIAAAHQEIIATARKVGMQQVGLVREIHPAAFNQVVAWLPTIRSGCFADSLVYVRPLIQGILLLFFGLSFSPARVKSSLRIAVKDQIFLQCFAAAVRRVQARVIAST